MLYQNSKQKEFSEENQEAQLIELIIAKQRNGPTGKVKLKFAATQNKFFDIDTND